MNHIKIAHFFAIISLFFLSCEDEPIDPAVPLNPVVVVLPTSFSTSFNSRTYTTDDAYAIITANQIKINASLGIQQEQFTFTIEGTTEGTYLTNVSIASYRAGTVQPWYISIMPGDQTANTGQITITSIDTDNETISGVFNFVGYYDDGVNVYTKQFDNGVFTNLPY